MPLNVSCPNFGTVSMSILSFFVGRAIADSRPIFEAVSFLILPLFGGDATEGAVPDA